jgi:hypothetical protein
MTRHFNAQIDRAGLGLELLPGVKQLLQALQVRCALNQVDSELSGCFSSK